MKFNFFIGAGQDGNAAEPAIAVSGENQASQTPETRWPAYISVLAVLFILTGVLLRGIWLDRIPGINGDEAWFGVRVMESFDGGALFGRTPTGNFVNPLYIGPLFALHWLGLPPSFFLLRIVALFAGILTVLSGYFLFRSVLGSRCALVFSAMLAAAPPLIAYGRLGWDPCETPLLSILVLAAALRGWRIATLSMLLLAMIVHPTNVFLLPVAVFSMLIKRAEDYSSCEGARKKIFILRESIFVLLCIGSLLLLLRYTAYDVVDPKPLGAYFRRLFSMSEWRWTIQGILLLLSPVTVSEYMSGPVSSGLRNFFLCVMALAGLGLIPCIITAFRRSASEKYMTGIYMTGLLASIAMFEVLAGPWALIPHNERYSLCLIVPILLGAAIALKPFMERMDFAKFALPAVFSLMAANLCGLCYLYLLPIADIGGASHQTFRTGGIEPKEAVYQFISDHNREGLPTAIYVENWWIYWPMRYLSYIKNPDLREDFRSLEPLFGTSPEMLKNATKREFPEKIYVVLFNNSPSDKTMKAGGRGVLLFSAKDPKGIPIINLFEIPNDSHGKNSIKK